MEGIFDAPVNVPINRSIPVKCNPHETAVLRLALICNNSISPRSIGVIATSRERSGRLFLRADSIRSISDTSRRAEWMEIVPDVQDPVASSPKATCTSHLRAANQTRWRHLL